MYRVFTECEYLSDVGYNFINRNKLTINQLPEHQHRSNAKLSIRIILWEFQERKVQENRLNER